MTRDDIIRMALEAGLYHFYDSEGHCSGITDVRLVNEDKERWDDRLIEMLTPFAAIVAAAEREACANECEEFYSVEGIAQECAAAIRERNKA